MKEKLSKLICVIVLLGFTGNSYAQESNYKQAWAKLNNGHFNEAVELFEKATKDENDKERAYLTLSMLYNDIDKIQKSNEYFMNFFDLSSNPLPETFALWFNESVKGSSAILSEKQNSLLNKILKHPKCNEFSDGVVNYNFGLDQTFAKNEKMTNFYYDKIGQLTKFSLVGPFDNLVNNGFDKDFGVLNLNNNSFISKYGKEISWFTPRNFYNDGYFLYDRYFVNSDALIYAQSFVESPENKDVWLKLGYSGVVKLWVNDSLVYSEPESRITEMDYYQIKMKLNKGYNRILIQLGTVSGGHTSFSIRFSDLEHQLLSLNHVSETKEYEKKLENVKFARSPLIISLQEKSNQNPDEILYKLLLIKAYLRSAELDEAEEVANELYNLYPKNYFILRQKIFINKKANKGTLQDKYYEDYKEIYPNDKDIVTNNIQEAVTEKNISKFQGLLKTYKKLYPHNEKEIISFELTEATLLEDFNKALLLIEKLYSKYPEDVNIVISKYSLEKEMNTNSKTAIKILENYYKKIYNYRILNLLVDEYWSLGNFKKAESLLSESISLSKFDEDAIYTLADIYFKRGDYQNALKYYQSIIDNRPNDHYTYNKQASLYQIKGENEMALSLYQKSLSYYPFSFDVHEKIRVLKSQKAILSQIEILNVEEIISDYKKNCKSTKKSNFDIVYNSESKIIYKPSTSAKVITYILKLNNEEALQTWQKIDLGSGYNFYTEINEAKTIKNSGSNINAERNGNSVVFTNLEVGDYIFIKYTEKQRYGGKSTKFFSDYFSFSSFNSIYISKYNLYTEPGVLYKDTIINGKVEPTVSFFDGFELKKWEVINPLPLENEPHMLKFNDISNRLHINAEYSWDDVTNWYNDLSRDQALIDFTIKELSNSLFPNKNYTDYEKAKIIYDFVLKNIQYSSIDFRQSSYIPQKASDVYITRLGDCKDVSTLYATIARNVGLDVDLVLINTSNNGTNNVLLPSLNFNHCMVKVKLKGKEIYLELTDPNLPFGHLNTYHINAAILDIPFKVNKSVNNKLKKLNLNEGFTSSIIRNSKIEINSKDVLNVTCNTIKTGSMVIGTINNYYNQDSTDRISTLKETVSTKYNSLVTIKSFDLVNVVPRNDTVNYIYKYEVDNDVNKIGSMKSIKIPFADKLLSSNLFESKERKSVLNYSNYEDNHFYKETIEFTIPKEMSFIELPQNVDLKYGDFMYSLNFKIKEKNIVEVSRLFKAELRNINPEEMPKFQEFMTQVLNAESTHLVYK
jgi:tetratricopeptide (TPR) repeat protein